MKNSDHSMTTGFPVGKNPGNSPLSPQPKINLMNFLIHPTADRSNESLNISAMNHNSSSSNTTSPLPTPITRYDEEFFETAYPEDNEFPSYSPTFYEDSSDTVWIRPNSLECSYERDDTIRFNLDHELPKDKELIVDYVEIVIYATGDHSNLTVELYLDNMLRTSIPYSHYQMTVFDLKKLNINEKDRTLSYSKNIMVRFPQNGCPHLNMGIGCASTGLPAGHIRGRLKDRNKLRPKSTYHYLTDHNKNVTGLTDAESNITATWDYDAFGNIIHQTGAQANLNPLRFSSEYHDEDLGLIYYNYRHYNPREGRWISRDPIGERGDLNMYSFIHNNGSFRFDILGFVECGMGSVFNGTFGMTPSNANSPAPLTCEKKRKKKMEKINNLISSQNAKESDCSESPTCKKITLMIEVSDPCREPIRYGHAGMAFEDEFRDVGTSDWSYQLQPYWSADNPTLPQAEAHAKVVATGPVLEVIFCVCEKEFNQMKQNWDQLQSLRDTSFGVDPITKKVNNILSRSWGFGGTCATNVARTLGQSFSPLIDPDDILMDIVPNLINSCGTERGKKAHVKILHNPWGNK